MSALSPSFSHLLAGALLPSVSIQHSEGHLNDIDAHTHTPHFLYNVLLIVAVHTYKHLSMYVVCMYVYLDIRSILVKGDTFFFQRINKSHLHTEKIKTKRTQTHHFPWCNSTLCIASCRDVAAEELHHANYQLQRQGGKEKEEEKKSIREV